ncbi:MAG: DUF2497 domain-containing protein [Alphaproteobacteria bacterium]|nr:DUF2497 domain-containing protein [Alphaproteobacteria bacterium]
MALQDSQSEPSMEEILASIRRIISEDEAQPSADPVLELSTPADDMPAPEDDDLLVFDKRDTPESPAAAVVAPVAAAPPPRPTAPVAAARSPDSITSEPVMSQAAGSFTRLAGSLRLADTQGQTVEGVVRELLQPMLREWLDQNLPAIVESKVEAELDRISRLAR